MARPWGNSNPITKIMTGKMNDICLVTACIDRSWSLMSGRGGCDIIRVCANVSRPAISGRMSTAGWSRRCPQLPSAQQVC